MARFFIDHPVFAWVIAILITLGGVICITQLSIEAYPDIAPPQVSVSTTYPGANAESVERAVTQVIEQQLTGIDRLLYFTSTSSSQGNSQITLTFKPGTNPDIAAVQTQARVQLAQPRLPAEVNAQGISVNKSSSTNILYVAMKSEDGRLDSWALNNILATQILDQITRIDGVGSTQQFGSEYAMRIWLNPDKLHAYGLSASQVLATVRDQNVQLAAGAVGATPSVPEQELSVPVNTQGRFSSPEQFENIIVRADPNGTTVRVRDVAAVQLAPYFFAHDIRIDDAPIAAFSVQLLPGADALQVTDAIKARMAQLQSTFPAGVSWFVPFDATRFIKISVREVAFTLAGAVVLVFVTMLIFLQSFRATLIPTLVMPVALMGAFIGMYTVGFSINTLSLFGVALAIGIVVDDAIVVIESVERIMREENLSPRQATRKAMDQITGAIVAITVVLAAVFIPSALQSGSVGAIYRQFALTIAISMLFSAFLALSFTPALCASILRPAHLKPNVVFRLFNAGYERTLAAYMRRVYQSVRHAPRWMAAFAALLVLGAFLFMRLPGGFLPEEDQGYVYVVVQAPPGATLTHTMKLMTRVAAVLHESDAVEAVMQTTGYSFVGQGENVGLGNVRLKPWNQRKMKADEFIRWANARLAREIHDAQAFVVDLATVRSLGNYGGFDFFLEDRSGLGHAALVQAEQTLLARAAESPILTERTCQYPRRCPAGAPRRRSGAGRVDGSGGERCVYRHSAHAGPGVCQRFLLSGPRAACAAAGRCALPHESGGAPALLCSEYFARREHVRLRRHLNDRERVRLLGLGSDTVHSHHDSALQRGPQQLGGRPAEPDALQRLLGARDHRLECPRLQLRAGDARDAAPGGAVPAARRRLRLGRSVLAGDRLGRSGTDALRALHPGGVSVSRGIV